MSKAQQFRDQSLEELEVAALELGKEIFDIRNSMRQDSKATDPNRIRMARKEVARIKTVMGEKKRKQEAGQ